MSGKREHPEVVVLKHIWPALMFAAVWLEFPHTRAHINGNICCTYALLICFALVTLYRMRVAVRKPNSPILKYFLFLDIVLLTIGIRFTGGTGSELWLFYYFLLIAAAMDTQPGTMRVTTALVISSYIIGTFPTVKHWHSEVVEIICTRLFFLFLTTLLARHIAQAQNRLSEEISDMSEQLTLSQERNRIAREIHDGIGHSLVNCILTLELCERLVCKKPEEACKIIEQEKNDLRVALDDMRDYVHHLRPAELETEPLDALIRKYLARFSDRTGISVQLEMKNDEIDLPASSRLVLLRIIQEALTNSAKHSDATEISVSVARTKDSGVHCVIVDNGKGFDEKEVLHDVASRQGFGLRTMKDRATSIGGDIEIKSAPDEGTRVDVRMPG